MLSKLLDLGYCNSWKRYKYNYTTQQYEVEKDSSPEIVKQCVSLGHHPQSNNLDPTHRGLDTATACEICGYLYHTDSSD